MRSNVRKRCGYSEGSISKCFTTSGVIQPAHSFKRGNYSLSSTSTSPPARFSTLAADEPAGPPPTIRTSTVCTLDVQVCARHRHSVVVLRREHDLEELQVARGESRDGAGEI